MTTLPLDRLAMLLVHAVVDEDSSVPASVTFAETLGENTGTTAVAAGSEELLGGALLKNWLLTTDTGERERRSS